MGHSILTDAMVQIGRPIIMKWGPNNQSQALHARGSRGLLRSTILLVLGNTIIFLLKVVLE